MKCPLPHCKTVVLRSLDKLKETDKHIFTHRKVKAVCVCVSGSVCLCLCVKVKGPISGFCHC